MKLEQFSGLDHPHCLGQRTQRYFRAVLAFPHAVYGVQEHRFSHGSGLIVYDLLDLVKYPQVLPGLLYHNLLRFRAGALQRNFVDVRRRLDCDALLLKLRDDDLPGKLHKLFVYQVLTVNDFPYLVLAENVVVSDDLNNEIGLNRHSPVPVPKHCG